LNQALVAVAVNSKPDSIYGLATPSGRSAISVIRVSGKALPKDLESYVWSDKGSANLCVKTLKLPSFSDQCLFLFFPSPNSYTGENVIEIHCHGNPIIVSAICSWLEGLGVREAERGEFSKRAYLNEKITLDQAEAISLGIEARSLNDLAAMNSFRSGLLANKIMESLVFCEKLLVSVESQIDFSDEEDVYEVGGQEVLDGLSRLSNGLGEILMNYRPITQKVLKPKVVLVGKPNVGKSSLFNQLVGNDVAIVSSRPGTTRDVVKGDLYLSGVEVEIGDTAGIRNTSSKIELAGIKRTSDAVKNADIVVWVSDLSDLEKRRPVCEIWVGNKVDKIKKGFSENCDLTLSAKTGEGIDLLVKEIKKRVKTDSNYHLVSERIYKNLSLAVQVLSNKPCGEDLFEKTAQDLRDVLALIKDIYGDFSNEKILDEIFQNFCIGK